MQDKFLSLRKEHPVFTFENYTIVELNNKLLIKYYFLIIICPFCFKPTNINRIMD